jgi:hypothetical protein
VACNTARESKAKPSPICAGSNQGRPAKHFILELGKDTLSSVSYSPFYELMPGPWRQQAPTYHPLQPAIKACAHRDHRPPPHGEQGDGSAGLPPHPCPLEIQHHGRSTRWTSRFNISWGSAQEGQGRSRFKYKLYEVLPASSFQNLCSRARVPTSLCSCPQWCPPTLVSDVQSSAGSQQGLHHPCVACKRVRESKATPLPICAGSTLGPPEKPCSLELGKYTLS